MIIENPKTQIDLPFDVHFCGFYQGQGRDKPNNIRTRLLLSSKYNQNIDAQDTIIREMAETAETIKFDVLSYALAHDSNIQFARLLAKGVSKVLGCDTISPNAFQQYELSKLNILLIDDVLSTGRTMKNLWLRLAPYEPRQTKGLVYLMVRKSTGISMFPRSYERGSIEVKVLDRYMPVISCFHVHMNVAQLTPAFGVSWLLPTPFLPFVIKFAGVVITFPLESGRSDCRFDF